MKPQKNQRITEYNLFNKNIKSGMKEANQKWIDEQCDCIDNLNYN